MHTRDHAQRHIWLSYYAKLKFTVTKLWKIQVADGFLRIN